MKAKYFREKSDEKLKEILKDLNFEMMKVKLKLGGSDRVKNKELGIKAGAKSGQKTKLQQQIRRNVAKIKTILREREIEKENGKER